MYVVVWMPPISVCRNLSTCGHWGSQPAQEGAPHHGAALECGQGCTTTGQVPQSQPEQVGGAAHLESQANIIIRPC